MRGLLGFAKCTAVLLTVQLLCVQNVRAWDNAEMDLFDLVEEVNKNFYEFMEIAPGASGGEIRKAYKTKALLLHPDKNTAPDADIQFRQLAGIYEVLKDKETRAMYDKVLVEGLPNWRTPAYYFRRMRKIGLAEGLLYLLVIATGIQYCMNKAAHWERGFTVSENINNEVKRRQKKLKKEGKTDEDIRLQYQQAEEGLIGVAPTIYDTLPFQLFRLVKYLVLLVPALPGMYRSMQEAKKAELEEELRLEREEEEEIKRREEEKEKKKENKARRRIMANTYREVTDVPVVKEEKKVEKTKEVVPKNAQQPWEDDDLATLAKYMKKYAVGTTDRWNLIAEHMERYSWEVTKMAGLIKNNPSLVPISSAGQGVTGRETNLMVSDSVLECEVVRDVEETEESDSESSDEVDEDGYVVYSAQKVEDYTPVEEKKKKKTRVEPQEGEAQEGDETADDEWSQVQQKALEQALAQYPKGTNERWDRISSRVDGKSKDQCMTRFRHLADLVKKKKESAD